MRTRAPQALLRKPWWALLALSCWACAVPADQTPAAAERVEAREWRFPGKPVAPIAIGHELSARPQLGLPLDVRFTISAPAAMNDVSLDVRADGKLVLGSAPSARVARLAVNEPFVWTVTVTPVQEGTARLSVTVEGELSGARQARNLVVPVRIGDAKPGEKPGEKPGDQPSAEVKTDESGEAIIALPARETP